MKATKIKMQRGCSNSQHLTEIDSIYLEERRTYWKKEEVYDYLRLFPRSIWVNLYPYPYLIPVLSAKGEKYVRSEANNTENDNLLNLPRE